MELTAIAAAISAACTVIETIKNFRSSDQTSPRELVQYQRPPGLGISEDDFAKLALSLNSYSDTELNAIRRRLENCRRDFAETLDGEARKRCICSVLRRVAIGNNGQLPGLDGWNETFNLLCKKAR